MNRRPNNRPIWILLVVGVALVAPTSQAHAGILDSIKSLFSGSSGGSDGGDQLTAALEQVELSQQEVAQSQQALTSYYNDPEANLSPDDPDLKSKLDAMESASRSNEQLYLQFLQMRGEASKQGMDLSEHEERLSQIASTQDQLETNYQRIQEANRDASFFEPPASVDSGDTTMASGIRPSGTTRQTELTMNSWMDPEVQGYIDEWLSGVGLNKWGQREGRFGNTVVQAANHPGDAGMFRHEIVFRMLLNERKGSNMTLKAYVEARMRGEIPDLEPGGGQVFPSATRPTTVATRGSATTPAAVTEPTDTAAPSSGTAALELAEVDQKLKESRKSLESMVAAGQGSSDEAKDLLDEISSLERDLRNLKEQMNRE